MTAPADRARLDAMLAEAAPVVAPLATVPVVVYGAGAKGREALALLREAGRDVAAFVDRQAKGSCQGVPILGLDDPAVASLAQDGCAALVAVFNPGADPLPIHAGLREAGFRNVIGMVAARQHMMAGDSYWLSTADRMTPPAAEAHWLFAKLADRVSRQTLIEAIGLRRSWDPRWLRAPTPADQYFPADLTLPRSAVRFVDGGAFDGDTIEQLQAAGFQFDALAAFEPDPANYAALGRRLSTAAPCDELGLWPCGLDASTRQVRFRAEGLASSGMAAGGDLVIQTVALDEALPRFRPTYVKLDIEGAEAAALKGMARTIQASRPALAVCVYHKPADLWELPLLIDDLLPDSDFYLRAHAWNGFELVLYAVPREMTHT